MEYIISWSIFGVCLVIILIIIMRKASLLAKIDVAQVASEKERALKEQIMADRLKRKLSRWGYLIIKFLKPISKLLRNGFDWLYNFLNNWQRQQVNRTAVLNQAIDKRIEALLAEAEDLIKADRLEAAEKKYIEIIGLDPLNFLAFSSLGEVYYHQQNFNEAKQTLEYALRLRRKASSFKESFESNIKDVELAKVNYLLGLVFLETQELTRAIVSFKRALKIEKNNPRYLDRLVEVSIMKKDKISAYEALKRLEVVNPENQKLEQFKQKIGELDS